MENKKSKKKIFIIVGIVVILAIIISVYIYYQMEWKGYKTYKTDKFSIKYDKSWEVKNETSDTGDVKNFTDNGDNSVRVISMPKSAMPENQNTLEKFRDNIIQQMEDSISSAFFNGEPNIEYVKKGGANGVKITFQYKTSEELIYIMYEKKDIFYSLFLQGKDIETFSEMEESFKIR